MINYQFNQLSISTLCSSFVILVLGIYILFQGRKRIENWSLFLATSMVFLWLSGMAMCESSKSSELALLWHNRYSFLGVALIAPSVYFLVISLINQFPKHKKRVFLAYLISIVFYILANITSSFSIQLTHWGYYPEYGSLGISYILYFLILIIYSLYLLISSLKSITDDLKRKQIKIFFVGLLLASIASSDWLLTLGNHAYPFGYILILTFIAITAFTIKKYSFLVLEPKIASGAIFDSIISIIIGIDIEDRISFVNKSVENTLGYEQVDILKNPAKMIFPEQEKFFQMKDEILKGKTYIRGGSSYLLARDGRKIPIRFSLSPIHRKSYGGRILGFVLIARDITEHKKDEKALWESEERYRSLFENMMDGLIIHKLIMDENGNPVDYTLKKMNSAAEKILSWKKKDIKGKKASEVYGGDIPYIERYAKVAQTGKSEYFTTYYPKSERWYEILSFCPEKGYFANILRDITERKKLENELKEYTEHLEQRVSERTKKLKTINEAFKRVNETLKQKTKDLLEAQEQLVRRERLAAIGQLASGIAHELRNPLGVIKTAVYYVKSKVEQDNPKVQKHLRIMEKEINSSDKIISDLLGFSQTRKPSVEPIHLNKIIENALLITELPENVKLIKRLSPSLPQVLVDANQIRQVFTNIILNAFQSMPEGGELKIETKEKAHFIEVKFTDTGCGISKENLNKLSNPFFTTKSKGIGLGLSVTQTIIERHNGTIQVKSKLGEGSTFIIHLPLRGKA